MSATRVRYEWHKSDTSATRTTRVLHEQHEYGTSEKINFDNETSKNLFSHPYIYYMASKRLQEEEQFRFKNYLLEMSRFLSKNTFKKWTTKLNFFNGKSYIKKLYTRV